MPSNFVYQYVWRDHSLPAHKGWILTLKDNEAIAFLAMVTTIVAYTQSRSWLILNDGFNQLTTGNIRLGVSQKPFSQSEAIGILLRVADGRRNDLPTGSFRKISPWIGVVAIANIVLFIGLGIVLPWTLSGGMETPIVRSRETDSCLGVDYKWEAKDKNAQLADNLYQRCWYNISTDSNPCGRPDGILNDRPVLWMSRIDECPFSGNSCKNSTIGVRLEHRNITPRHYGLNLKSRILTSHRLTCSPLETASFQKLTKNGAYLGFLSFLDLNQPDMIDYAADYVALLYTLNGPNQYSNDRSGRQALLDNRPVQLGIWPSFQFNQSDTLRKLDSRLRRRDGSVFIVGLRAGRSYYPYPMDDPLFSAHDLSENDGVDYFPDYEITTVGCVEQHQFCLNQPALFCTPWTFMGDPNNTRSIHSKLIEQGDLISDADLFSIYYRIMSKASVQDYLLARKGIKALISFQRRGSEIFQGLDTKEQWIIELKAWFETAFLQARYGVFGLLERDRPPNGMPQDLLAAKRKYGKLCNQAVFFDGNYTNIDFIKLLITLSCLLLICLLSIRELLANIAKKIGTLCWANLKSAFGFCYKSTTWILKKLTPLPLPAIRLPQFRILRRRTVQSSPGTYARDSFWNPRNNRRMETPIIQPDDVSLQDLECRLSDNISNFIVEATSQGI